jgi:hypothetical protein
VGFKGKRKMKKLPKRLVLIASVFIVIPFSIRASQAASNSANKIQQSMNGVTVRVWVKDDHTNQPLDSTLVEMVNRADPTKAYSDSTDVNGLAELNDVFYTDVN